MEQEGFVQVEGGRIWYQVLGEGGGVPLVVLHGGPGSSHLGMQRLAVLQEERPVVLYDQLGCGKSDRPTDSSLWVVDRFTRELVTLREVLGLEKVHILGHSWGTMLLADYLLTRPTGVVSAIFSSPCLSAPRWVADANVYRDQLPRDVQSVLQKCEVQSTTDSEAYCQATEVYMQRHVCRVTVPAEEKAARDAAFGTQVYHTMWGPSEFYPTGNLKTFDCTDRLHEIQLPSLFTCGAYDEATPESTQYYSSLVPNSEFHVFAGCSHSPLREQPEVYLNTVRNFLSWVERA
ncbi:alpha/beta fold hydrolase [Alicyclobacillaceae bacterium I2511]|nr:alpha/beta fold hydrolase [Alicyclobacillaceae bacterium I2511]